MPIIEPLPLLQMDEKIVKKQRGLTKGLTKGLTQ